MSGELKPCPFCGSNQVALGYSGTVAVVVGCQNCLAQGPIIRINKNLPAVQSVETAEREAVIGWNLRLAWNPVVAVELSAGG